jgi:hypothetical protein
MKGGRGGLAQKGRAIWFCPFSYLLEEKPGKVLKNIF